jgi:two-component system, LuxR family, sensor kinase FixL
LDNIKRRLAERFETYQDLFDNALDLIHVVEPDGTIIYVNNAWITVLGYSSDETEGKSIYSFVHKDDRDRFIQYRENIIQGVGNNNGVVVSLISRAGSRIYVDGSVTAKFDNGKALYTRGIFRDISARLKNEEQLRLMTAQLKERESNLRQLLHHAPDAIIVIDAESRIRYWNPKATDIFGWTADEVSGKRITEVIIPVQHREAHDLGMKRYLQTGEQHVLNKTIEITALDKHKREFYVALTISATMQDSEKAFIAFIRDIDDQKRNAIELQQKRSQLEQSNQQLEQFAHVASHDMKEPIRKIKLFTERIRTDAENSLSELSKKHISKIERSASSLTALVDGILSYSSLKGEEFKKDNVDLNEVMKNVVSDLELVLQQKDAVVKYKNLPSISCAPLLIYQLFYNLISNALKFSRPEMSPVVDVTAAVVPKAEIIRYRLDKNIPYFEIMVRDNGIGFSQQYAERIFDAFARLNSKEKFEGTGLGLALCKTIVERHGGVIKAFGTENVGSKFVIILPA